MSQWLRWTMQQYNIPSGSPHAAATVEQWSQLGGQGFSQLTENEFRDRFAQVKKHFAKKRTISFATICNYFLQIADFDILVCKLMAFLFATLV